MESESKSMREGERERERAFYRDTNSSALEWNATLDFNMWILGVYKYSVHNEKFVPFIAELPSGSPSLHVFVVWLFFSWCIYVTVFGWTWVNQQREYPTAGD
jgi:hypothetical protein